MKQCRAIIILLAALSVVSNCDLFADQPMTPRPNVILFLVDDMGWLDSSPYGSEYYETPNMARLERQSMRFTNAYAVPLCSPTRASILSGQYSSRHGVTSASGHQPAAPKDASPYPAKGSPKQKFIYAKSKNYLDLEIETLAEVLKRGGYRTAHIGKWHLGLSQEHWPEQHGFEVAFHAEPSPGPKSYFSPYGVSPTGEPSGRNHVGTITDGPDGEYITDRLTDEAIKFIEQHKDEPFYLNFWHFAVHGPWGHKEEYTRRFAQKTDPRGFQKNPIMASMLKSVDGSLGRIIDKLDELDLTDNTILIFYSDNGGNTHSNVPGSRQIANIKPGHPKWGFVQNWKKWAGDQPPTNNAPLREGKGRIYEGGQRVPLMVRWPGKIQPASLCDAVVGPIDLYPTILEAVALDIPANHIVDGESIVPILKQTGELKRRAYFTWFPHLIPAVSVRQGDWKLIRRFEPHASYPEVRELYDLGNDIGESKNLAEEMPEKVKELDGLIDEFVKETNALYPKPNPNYGTADSTKQNGETVAVGLVPKQCRIERNKDSIQVVGEGRSPFLGTAQVRMPGPIEMRLNLRAPSGGEAKIYWKIKGQDTFPDAQSAKYEVEPSKDWQDIKLDLPIKGTPQIIRIGLPCQNSPVEIRSIEFANEQSRRNAWRFNK